MSRRFAQIPLTLWRDDRFRKLSSAGRQALLYIWSGPHSTSAGIGIVFDGYACLDLGWKPEDWTHARTEIEEAGFIARDSATETILVHSYFESNRPSNTRHLAAIRSQIASITCTELRETAEQSLTAILPEKSSQQVSGVSPQLRSILDKKP
jgi:hypothetical protein